MKTGGWAVRHDSNTFDEHVVPINDLREHVLSMQCWCKPERDEEAPGVIAHNSLDQREAVERGERRVQ